MMRPSWVDRRTALQTAAAATVAAAALPGSEALLTKAREYAARGAALLRLEREAALQTALVALEEREACHLSTPSPSVALRGPPWPSTTSHGLA